jgi:hypothetical protein
MKLSELLRTYRDRERTTWAEMAARATQRGYPITRQYFSTIAKHGLREVPGADIIRAIAVATREDPNAIYLAAGEELGFRVEGPFVLDDPVTKTFLALTADRSPEEIEHLLETVRMEARRLDLYRQGPANVTDSSRKIGQASEDE